MYAQIMESPRTVLVKREALMPLDFRASSIYLRDLKKIIIQVVLKGITY